MTETATFGNGCFWCTEAVFQNLKGVISTRSGYSGGHLENPDYKTVCAGTTEHAEVNQVVFDPALISYADILEIFWNTHDPTTLNRQGTDIGTQYRSVIFYHNDEQKKTAETYKRQLEDSKIYKDPIVTEIVPFEKFYPAEDYHTNYFNLNPENSYCQYVVRPKVEKFRKKYADRLK